MSVSRNSFHSKIVDNAVCLAKKIRTENMDSAFVPYTKSFQQSKEQRFKVFDNRTELTLYIKDDDFSEFFQPHCYM